MNKKPIPKKTAKTAKKGTGKARTNKTRTGIKLTDKQAEQLERYKRKMMAHEKKVLEIWHEPDNKPYTITIDKPLPYEQNEELIQRLTGVSEQVTPSPPQQTEYAILFKVLTQAEEWKDEPLIEVSYLRTATELIKQMIHGRHLSQLPTK